MEREVLKDNPFYHVVKLSWTQWASTIAFGAFLVPLRFALIAAIFVCIWMPYCIIISLLGPNKPVTALEKTFVVNLFTLLFNICGVWAKKEGVECDPSESRIIVVGPHMSIWEGIAHGHGNTLCSCVCGAQSTKWFMLGTLVKRLSIIVDKMKKESRLQANEAILKWLEDRDSDPSLLPEKIIFCCEGWYTNGSKLLPFKNGAFRPGRPVQVYVLSWETAFIPITTYGQNISWFLTTLIMMAQPYTIIKSRALPVYHPSDDEKADADLYADNISKLMSRDPGYPKQTAVP